MQPRVIGGLVFWDADRRVPPAALEAMAGRVPGAGAPHTVGHGPVGLFTCVGLDSLLSTDTMWSVADLDLTNRDELQDLAGLRQDVSGLLAALYDREGPAFVRRLQGAFALALWDRRQRTLLLAVDRFGIKRLHYATDHRRTAFASRPSALLAAPGLEARADPTQVYNYLNFEFVPAPASIFAGIRRLPPAHVLVLREGKGGPEPYWDMEYLEQPARKADSPATLYRLTEGAVSRALRGAEPKEVGAFLSGGTDSSTVVGLMGRVTGERTNAFSIGFREERYDELGYARLAARHFGAAHYTQIVTPEDALGSLPRLIEAFDEPFGNNSAIGTFFCAQLARQCGVPLLLAGDGGDEIFGGNERYRTDRVFAFYHLVPATLRRRFLEPVLRHLPDGEGSLVGRAQRYVRRASMPNPRRFYSYEFYVAQHADSLLDPDFRAAFDAEAPYALTQAYYDRPRATAELNRLLYLDLKLTIGDNDLLKVMRTAEVAGMAVRFPLLDLPLVEFTGTWPARLKVRGLEKRHLFKRAFRDLLPPEILGKPKHGFGVPTSDWLKYHPGFRTLAQDTMLSARARQRGYFRPRAIEDLFRRHSDDPTPYYGELLWSVLMLELWHRKHLDGEGAG